jgi:ComF family protein
MENARAAAQFGAEGLRCTPCRMVPPEFARAVAYGVYGDGMREMLHLLKYDGQRGMAGILGGMVADAVLGLAGEMPAGEVLVVAVPLHPAKRRQRGYNQAELLASAAMVALRARAPEWRMRAGHGVLVRTKDTDSQFGLTPRARRANLRGAFEVIDPVLLAAREVLLVDDIYTTGATARACAKVLRAAGAGRVWVVTLSRAQTETVAMWDMATETVAWDAGVGSGMGSGLGSGLGSGPHAGPG